MKHTEINQKTTQYRPITPEKTKTIKLITSKPISEPEQINPEEQNLLKLLRQGDQNAFWDLWLIYKEELRPMCLALLSGSQEDAEDAMSNAMLRAWNKSQENIHDIVNYKGWLIRLTRNVCFDLLREKNRHSQNCNDIEAELVAEKNDTSAENDFLFEETMEEVHKAIEQLPVRLRETYTLHFILGLGHEEIAIQQNLTNANVRKRIQQARNALKQILNRNDTLPAHFADKMGHIESKLGDSQTAKRAQTILNREVCEIKTTSVVTRLTRIRLPQGGERDILLFPRERPKRLETRAATLRKYLEKHPQGWKKRRELAEILYAQGQPENAAQEMQLVLERCPRLLEERIRLGHMLLELGHTSQARQEFEQALPLARNDSTGCHLRGLMEYSNHQYETAAQEFTRAMKLEPDNVVHARMLGLSHYSVTQPVEALQAFEKALRIDPDDLISRQYAHELMLDCHRYETAARHAEFILEQDPDNVPALKYQSDARCYKGLVRGPEGRTTRELLRRMRRLAPEAVGVHESHALYYFRRGETEKSRQVFETQIPEGENSPNFWRSFARFMVTIGDYRRAGEAILKAYSLDPADARIACDLCSILPRADQHPHFHELLNVIATKFAQNWDVLSAVALALCVRSPEYFQARELAAQAVGLQPNLPEAHFRYGRVLAVMGPQEAIEALQEGLTISPPDDNSSQSAPATLLLAQCMKSLGDEDGAHTWAQFSLERAKMLGKFFLAEGLFHEGQALLELGEERAANSALRRAYAQQLPFPLREKASALTA